MEDMLVKGVPSMGLMPAVDYMFKVNDKRYVIEIPRKGSYNELAPEIFSVEDGEFNIYDESKKTLYLPSITKVLFATGKYPELASNQLFVPYAIKMEDDKVVILAQVADMVTFSEEAPEVTIDNNEV